MFGQSELVHRPDMRIDHPKNNFSPEPLPNHTCPITGELVFIGKVGIAACVELLLVHFRHEGLGQSYRLLSGQPWRVRPHWLQSSMYPPDWWRGHAQVNVRRVRLLPDLEILIHVLKRMRCDWRS